MALLKVVWFNASVFIHPIFNPERNNKLPYGLVRGDFLLLVITNFYSFSSNNKIERFI